MMYPASRLAAPPKETKSFAAEVLPFLALVVGVPLVVWWSDKKQKESFRRA